MNQVTFKKQLNKIGRTKPVKFLPHKISGYYLDRFVPWLNNYLENEDSDNLENSLVLAAVLKMISTYRETTAFSITPDELSQSLLTYSMFLDLEKMARLKYISYEPKMAYQYLTDGDDFDMKIRILIDPDDFINIVKEMSPRHWKIMNEFVQIAYERAHRN